MTKQKANLVSKILKEKYSLNSEVIEKRYKITQYNTQTATFFVKIQNKNKNDEILYQWQNMKAENIADFLYSKYVSNESGMISSPLKNDYDGAIHIDLLKDNDKNWEYFFIEDQDM